jgi:hypothetical protein
MASIEEQVMKIISEQLDIDEQEAFTNLFIQFNFLSNSN